MYKRNFLSQVLLKVNFKDSISAINDALISIGKEILIKDFGGEVNLEKRIQKQVEFPLSADNSVPAAKVISTGLAAVYKIPKENLTIELFPEHFLIHTDKFSNFREFKDNFLRIYRLISPKIEKIEYSRVGLRYINIFTGSEFNIQSCSDWDDYFECAFRPNYTDKKCLIEKFTPRRLWNQYFYSDDDLRVQIRTGLWNSNYPGVINPLDFTVDIDCSLETIITMSDLLEKVDGMNDVSYSFFESIISDKTKEILIK